MYGEQNREWKKLTQISRVEQKHNFSHNADACLMILFSDSDIKSCELSPTRQWEIILVCNKNETLASIFPASLREWSRKVVTTVNQRSNISAESAHDCMWMCGRRSPITHKLHRQYLDLCWASSYKWIWSEINNYFTSIRVSKVVYFLPHRPPPLSLAIVCAFGLCFLVDNWRVQLLVLITCSLAIFTR